MTHLPESEPRRRRRRTPEVAEQEIIAAAEALLRERPFRELTVDEVMRRTELSRPSFYVYFRDRHHLVLRVVEHIGGELYTMADRWFNRHGNAVVFWSRMLPIVRTFISLPAGVARMPFMRFTIYTFLGALPWCTLLTLIGVKVGENWETWEGRLKYIDYLVAVILVAIVVRLYLKWRKPAAA